MSGFGSDPFGSGPWGGGSSPTIVPGGGKGGGGIGPGGGGGPIIIPAAFTQAMALAENVIRVYFTAAVYISGLLDIGDAADPSHYVVTPVAGTTGRDGNPPRPVSVLFAQAGDELASIDLVLDRPMTPIPGQYSVATQGLLDGATKTPVMAASGTTLSLYRNLVALATSVAVPSRDVANPSSMQDLATSSPYANPSAPLGTYAYDDTGDYAFDEGIVSYKKRCIRRGITQKNAFAHLPGYGVGIPSYGKRLQRASLRDKLSADWEQQIQQEPETAQVSVTSRQDPATPSLVYFAVRARTKAGQSASFLLPVSIGTGQV